MAKYLLDSATLADSYVESNISSQVNIGTSFALVGQAFTSTGGTLKLAKFSIKYDPAFSSAYPRGPMYARLYAVASGTVGSTAVPSGVMGSYLAQSEPVDPSVLTNDYSLIEFYFSGANAYTMTSGTAYVIAYVYESQSGSDRTAIGVDTTSPTHTGNQVYFDVTGAGWGVSSTTDTIFYLYTNAGVSTDAYVIDTTGTNYYLMDDNRPPAVSPSIQNLSDNFSGYGIESTYKWDYFGTANANSNRLEVIIPAGGAAINGIYSANTFSLYGSEVITQVVDGGDQTLASLQVYPMVLKNAGDTTEWYWIIRNGNINAKWWNGTTVTTFATIPYVPATHRYFRIRESGGTTYWDWSTDSVTWNNVASQANSLAKDLLDLTLYLYGYTTSAEATSTQAIFDNVNAPYLQGNDTTPDLYLVADEPNDDDTNFEVQIDTVATFDSVATTSGGTYATPVFVQGQSTTGSGTNPSTAFPSVPAVGNLLVASVSTVGTTAPTMNSTGWTALTDVGSGPHLRLFYKVSTGSADQIVDVTTATGAWSLVVTEYSGVTTTGSLNVQNAALQTASTSYATPTLTPTGSAGALLIYVTLANGAGTWSANAVNGSTTGVNARYSPTNSSTYSLRFSDLAITSGVSGTYQGTATFSASTAGETAIAMFNLQSTGGGGTTYGPLIDADSSTDAGFSNVTTPADTAPFTNNNLVKYTVQTALSPGTYFARYRAIAPNGNNVLSSWATMNPLIIAPTTVVSGLRQYDGDNLTPVAIGSQAPTGLADGVVLEMDVGLTTNVETDYIAPEFEVEDTSTAFNNMPTVGGAGTWYNQDEPRAIRGAPVVWDSIQKRFLTWSGDLGATSTRTIELWELKVEPGAKWKLLNASGTYPVGMYQGGLAFDAINNQLIVVFGFTTTDTNTLYYCTFANTPEGVWVSRTPSGTAPLARSNITGSTITDYTDNCCYVVCGWGASYYNGVYKLQFSSATPGGTWSTLSAEGAVGAPTRRRNAVAGLDAVGNRIVMFGGNSGTANLNDTWQFSLSSNTWTQMTPTGTTPAIRENHCGDFDPINRRLIMAWGYSGTVATSNYDELWTLDCTTTNGNWVNQSQGTGSQPLGKFSTTACYSPDVNGVILYGGVDRSTDTQHQTLLVSSDETSNMTVYGLGFNHYMRPMDAPAPVWNSDRSEAVFVGGYSQIDDNATIADGGHVSDVFAYRSSENAWRVATRTLKMFSHREGIMAAYDTVNDRVLAFGGLWGNSGSVNGVSGCQNDIWEIKANANGDYDVRRMNPSGTKPPIRWLGNCAFDAAHNRFVVTCGADGISVYNDVWQLDLTSGDGTWSQLTPTGTAPTANAAGYHAYDTTNNNLYIACGGTDAAISSGYTTQFAKLNLTNVTPAWTILAVKPGAFRSAPLSIDVANQKLMLFGGYNGTSVLDNAYIYDIAGNTWSAAIAPSTRPAARRSAGGWFDPTSGKYYISHGRPISGTWYEDTWQFTPNYTTPASSTWTNMSPVKKIRTKGTVTGLTNNTAYHWQGWAEINGADGTPVSAGGNTETSTDFYLGTIAVVGANMSNYFFLFG